MQTEFVSKLLAGTGALQRAKHLPEQEVSDQPSYRHRDSVQSSLGARIAGGYQTRRGQRSSVRLPTWAHMPEDDAGADAVDVDRVPPWFPHRFATPLR